MKKQLITLIIVILFLLVIISSVSSEKINIKIAEEDEDFY